jgi:hypothetical protein
MASTEVLSFEEAMGYLGDGEIIHVARQTGLLFIEARWPRESVSRLIREYGAYRIQQTVPKTKYGLALYDEEGLLLIQTTDRSTHDLNHDQ